MSSLPRRDARSGLVAAAVIFCASACFAGDIRCIGQQCDNTSQCGANAVCVGTCQRVCNDATPCLEGEACMGRVPIGPQNPWESPGISDGCCQECPWFSWDPPPESQKHTTRSP